MLRFDLGYLFICDIVDQFEVFARFIQNSICRFYHFQQIEFMSNSIVTHAKKSGNHTSSYSLAQL